jgi:hypothetical protein
MLHDPVEKPQHYSMGKIQVLDFILDQKMGYLAGNVTKYLCRYRFKGEPVQDLKKAKFYLERLIKETETENGNIKFGSCNCSRLGL